VPRVADTERANVDALGYADDGIVHVTANFGYMETPNVPHVLRLLDPSQTEGRIAVDGANYFLSNIELVMGTAADDVPVAQVPVHRHVPYHRRRRRAFRPTAGSHGDHGFANRGVARLLRALKSLVEGLPTEDQSQSRASPWESNEVRRISLRRPLNRW
jgi:K+ transporter